MNEQVAGINITDYAVKKAAGLLSIAKIGDAYAIAVKTFSPENGVETSPQVYGISIAELQTRKEELLKMADDVQLLITDFGLLK